MKNPVNFQLPPENALKIRDVLKGIINPFDKQHNDDRMIEFLIDSHQRVSQFLTYPLHKTLFELKYGLTPPPIIVIRGLPVDSELVDTPTNGFRPHNKKEVISEAVLAAVCQNVGLPFAFECERNGAGLIHEVAPNPELKNSQSSEGSETDLGMHKENAYATNTPNFVALFCLRPDPEKQAETIIVDVRDVLPIFTSEENKTLRKPIYRISAPNSFGGSQKTSGLVPIIEGDESDPTLHFSMEGKMVVETKCPHELEEAKAVMQKMNKLMNNREHQYRIKLEQGDMVIMNNNLTAHGRSFFNCYGDGRDRWLQRMFVRWSLYENRFERVQGRIGVYN